MTRRYMLTARAQMGGALREPGFVFTLAKGEKGPTRAIVASDHGASQTGHWRHDGFGPSGELREEPLYVEIKDEAALIAEAKSPAKPKPGAG